jgi:peptide/nickel transport system substrate-binding protein
MYKELQQAALDTSPFVMIFQQTEVAGRGNVKNYKLGRTSIRISSPP